MVDKLNPSPVRPEFKKYFKCPTAFIYLVGGYIFCTQHFISVYPMIDNTDKHVVTVGNLEISTYRSPNSSTRVAAGNYTGATPTGGSFSLTKRV